MKGYDTYRSIQQYKADGLSQRKIAETLHINRATIKKLWNTTDSQFQAMLPQKERLHTYKHIIEKLLSEGKSAAEICNIINCQFNESFGERTVSRYIKDANNYELSPTVLKKSSNFQINYKNRGDGFNLLNDIITGSIAEVFFDPQYRGLLDDLHYGNEGTRQTERIALPQMNEATICKFIDEIERVLRPSGYLFLWVDKFHLCESSANNWLDGTDMKIVDLITWEKPKIGMGYRTRRKSEYLVIVQKLPCTAKATWNDHAIPDVWKESSTGQHPHSKPVQLQKRLILATTKKGDTILDPCAGGFSVLEACALANRNFIGTDLTVD